MSKRFLSAVIALLVFVGFGVPQVAQADSPYSATTASQLNIDQPRILALNDSNSLLIWTEFSEGTRSLKSAVMSMDGTISNVQTLDSGNSFLALGDQNSWTILPDGTVAVTWVKSSDAENSGTTKSVNVAFTEDGTFWSQTVSPFEPVLVPENNCFFGQVSYLSSGISSDGLGNLALWVENSPSCQGPIDVLAKTTQNGTTWSAASVFGAQLDIGQLQDVQGLPTGGFTAIWRYWDMANSNFYSSKTFGSTIMTWSRPALIESVQGFVQEGSFVQTSPTTMGYFFATEVGNSYTIFFQKNYNFVTKAWSNKLALDDVDRGFPVYRGLIGSYKNGVAVITAAFGIHNDTATFFRTIHIVNGVTQPVLAGASFVAPETTPLVAGSRADGSIFVGWAGQNFHPAMSVYKNGSLVSTEEIPLGASRAYGKAAVSPNGNIFFYFNHYSPDIRLTMTYRGAIAPAPSGNLLLKGVAKVGKTIKATVPVFSSPSGIGVTKFQWYVCSAKVTIVQPSIPAGCSLIKKATGSSYKLTSSQKKKYLGLAITNTNAVGTATMFSPTTAKTS